MKSYILPLCLLCVLWVYPRKVHAQIIEIGYAPINVSGWGKLPQTTKFNLSAYLDAYQYGAFRYTPGLRFSHINSGSALKDKYGESVNGTFIALFVIPLAFEIDWGRLAFVNRIGLGYANHAFPNKNGLHFNFLLEAGFRVAIVKPLNFSVRYSHVSNGFRGQINPGVDNILFVIGFHL